MEYMILKARAEYQINSPHKDVTLNEDTTKLTNKINGAIKQGWKPQGGICRDEYHLRQAMIKV